jgi:hypothetical protein
MPVATKSLSFGTNKYVTMGDVLDDDGTGVLVFSFWLKCSSGTYPLILKQEGVSPYLGYAVWVDSDKIRWDLVHDTTTNALKVEASMASVATGQWTHVVVMSDGSRTPGGMRVYVNGVQQVLTTITNTLTLSISNSYPFQFGKQGARTDWWFTGNLTQVVKYTRMLTSAEVADLYNQGNPPNVTNLSSNDAIEAYWPLGEGDVFPVNFERALDPVVLYNAGTESSFYQLSNKIESIEWCRGEGLEDTAPYYEGPGGVFCPFSTKFDVDAFYRAGPINNLAHTSPWTMSVWLKWNYTDSRNGVIMGRFVGYPGGAEGYGYGLYTEGSSSGAVGISTRFSGVSQGPVVQTTAETFNDNNWHHVVATYDGSQVAGGMHIWVDGEDEPLTILSSATLQGLPTASFCLAGYADTAGTQSFEGFMSQPTMWGRVLGVNEIEALYNGGVPAEIAGFADPSLLGYWRMGDGDTFPVISDNIGSNDAIIQQASPPFSQTSCLFDGSNEYVTMGNASELSFERTDAFSVSCWFKLDPGDSGYLMSKMDAGPTGYGLFADSSNTRIYIQDTSSFQIEVTTTSAYDDGIWHHVVVTYDGTSLASGISIYIDGSSVGTSTVDDTLGTNSILNTASFNVSSRTDGAAGLMDGKIDEAAVYDKELSSGEVAAIYNGGIPVDLSGLSSSPSLVGWWRMGDGDTFPTLTDNSSNSNDGTAVNMESEDFHGDAPGKFSLLFDGVDEYVTMGNVTELSFERTDAFSISFWFKSTSTVEQYIVGKTAAAPAYTGYLVYLVGSVGTIRVQLVADVGSSNYLQKTTVASYNDGAWHHVVIAYNGSSKAVGVSIYVDGVQVSTTDNLDALSSSIATTAAFEVGDASAATSPFVGQVKDVAVYDKELFAVEVVEIHQGGALLSLPTSSGLLGYWRLGDGDTFPTATDSSVSGNDGTMTNMESADIVNDAPLPMFFPYYSVSVVNDTTPRFSQLSCLFNGTDEYVTMGNVLDFDTSDPFSVSFWIKTTETNGANVISKREGASAFKGWTIWLQSSSDSTEGAIAFYLVNDSSTSFTQIETSVAVHDGSWHHVAVTWDGNIVGGASGIAVYVDNVSVSFSTISDTLGSNSISNTASLNLATRTDGAAPYFPGSLDEVAIYDVELPEVRVSEVYNEGLPVDLLSLGTSGNLVGWWRMGEGDTFPTLTDNSSNSNDGTMTNMESSDIQADVPIGKFSLLFGGTNEYVTMGDVLGSQTDWDQDFSVAVWFKSTDSGYTLMVSKAFADADNRGWYLAYSGSTGIVEAVLRSDDSPTSESAGVASTATGLSDGQWHLAVFTWEGTVSSAASNLKLYVDGVEGKTVTSDNLGGTIATTGPLVIGARFQTPSDFFVGNLDDVAIYSKVLSTDEVQEIYSSGNPTLNLNNLSSGSALIGYWKCGDGDTFPTLTDNSSNSNDGTMTNMESTDIVNDAPTLYTLSTYSTKSLLFGAAQADVFIGDVLDSDYRDLLSISLWFKWSVSHEGVLVSKLSTSTGTPGYQILCGTNNKLVFFLVNTYPTNAIEVETDGVYNDGFWHHLTVTYDGSEAASGVTIYVDGIEVARTTNYDTLSATTVTSANLRFGGRDAGDIWFQGNLDEIEVYNRELSPEEVIVKYNQGSPQDPTIALGEGLLSQWPMGSEGGNSKVNGSLLNMDSSNTVTGPGGALPQAFSFNGSNESINFGNRFNFEVDQAFTVGIWFRTSTAATQVMVGNMDSTLRGYNLYMDSSTKMQIQIAENVSERILVETDTSGYADNNWHLMLMSYDGSGVAAGVTVYMDGSSVATTTIEDTGPDTLIDTSSLRVGCRGSVGTLYFTGDLTGFYFWGSELQAADATALWNGGLPVDPTGLASAIYLVGYWALGSGYYPGTMTGMSTGDIVDDVPSSTTLTTEKSWTTVANYDLGGSGESSTEVAQLILLDWKNKLVANGWSVIGSGTSLAYEYEGVTSGPFDLWSVTGDIVYRDSNSGLGPMSWVVLQSPVTSSGQFWLTLAFYGPGESSMTAYVSNSPPTVPASPLADYPKPSTDEWFWMLEKEQFFRYASSLTAVRSYFSIAQDGSFVFGRQTMDESDWNAYQMFHVLSDDGFLPDNFPMRSAAAAHYWTSISFSDWFDTWHCYVPSVGSVPCSLMFGNYGIGTDDYEQELFVEDTVSLKVMGLPVYLVRVSPNIAGIGVQTILARVPDIYISNSSVGRGAMAPITTPYLFTNIEGRIWIPGDTEPNFT